MLNKILSLFKKPATPAEAVSEKVTAVNTQPVNPQITDSVTSKQAKEVAAAVKEKIVKPNVRAKVEVQTAKKTRTKKPKQ